MIKDIRKKSRKKKMVNHTTLPTFSNNVLFLIMFLRSIYTNNITFFVTVNS